MKFLSLVSWIINTPLPPPPSLKLIGCQASASFFLFLILSSQAQSHWIHNPETGIRDKPMLIHALTNRAANRGHVYLTSGNYFDRSLPLGCPPLFTLILIFVAQHRRLTIIGQNKAFSRTLWLSLEIKVLGTERRAQDKTISLILKQ